MKKAVSIILSLVMLLTLVAGCSGGGDTSGASPDASSDSGSPSAGATSGGASGSGETPDGGDKDLTLAVGTTNTHYYIYGGGSNQADQYGTRLVYNYLFEVGKDGVITSEILESWEWVTDTTFKLVLKDGIYFNNGTKMTGNDIIFSLYNNIVNESTSARYYEYIDYDKSYVEDDGLTTYIEYYNVYGAYYTMLIMPLMCQEYAEQHDQSESVWRDSPVGSGPYEVVANVMDSYVTYKLREDYWDKSASFQPTEITVYYYSDVTTMFADFQNGVLDIALNINDTQVKQMQSGGIDGQLVLQSNSDCLLLCFNETSPYLTDPVVKEAIACAVDWDAVGEVTYGTLATTATSHFASNLEGFYAPHEGYSYDPDYAKQLLSDAGYAEGEITLSFVGTQIANHGVVGEALQAYLGKIGINLEVNVFDLNTMLSKFIEGDGDLSLQSLAGSGGNPEREPNRVLSAMDETNFPIMRITDSYFNQLVQAGLQTTDTQERIGIYQEIDDWLYENYLALPICETLEAFVCSSRIDQAPLTAVNGCFLQWVTFK